MDTVKLLKSYFNQINSEKNGLEIILIAHVDEPRGKKNNFQLQCSSNEFFRINEFGEIYQGIVDAGFFIRNVFFNEIDFIEDYIKNPNKYTNQSLIFTLARNGSGNNKKALIPAFCDITDLKYTSSSSFACSLARNKYYFSSILNSHNIPTPKAYYYIGRDKWLDDKVPYNWEQLIIKPSASSASQGIQMNSICSTSDSNFADKINILYENTKSPVLIQHYIDGVECEVPIFQFKDTILPLNPIMIITPSGLQHNILTAEISDNNDYDFKDLGEQVSDDVIQKIKSYATGAFQCLNLRHYGRVDFRVDRDGNPYIIDVSTTPYITKHSSFAYEFERLGLEYHDIFSAIISSALL